MQRTHLYAGRQAAQPSNTYLSVYSQSQNYYYSYESTRFSIYCCFNHSYYSGYIGSFTDPYGNRRTNNFYDLRVYKYDISSSYAGCIGLVGYERYYYNSLSYTSGVYTCNRWTNSVNFALYNYNSECRSINLFVNIIMYYVLARIVPTIYRFRHIHSSNSVLSLTCETRTAPPTEITWQRNGVNLTIDGSVIQMTQTITSRRSSYFTSTLTINDDPDNVAGNYSVIVGNSFGHTTSSNISIHGNHISSPDDQPCLIIKHVYLSIGITMTSSTDIGTVGSTIKFDCTSDLDPIRIEWFRNNELLSQTYETSGNVTLDLISTDDEGVVYTCSAIGRHGSQERNKTLSVKGIILPECDNINLCDTSFDSTR